jgi:hypothetical protein
MAVGLVPQDDPKGMRITVGLPRIPILQIKSFKGTGGCVGTGRTTRIQVLLPIASFKTGAQPFD